MTFGMGDPQETEAAGSPTIPAGEPGGSKQDQDVPVDGAQSQAACSREDNDQAVEAAGEASPAEEGSFAPRGDGEGAEGPGCPGEVDCGAGAPEAGAWAGASPGAAPPGPAAPVSRPVISPALRAEILEYVQAFAIAIVLAAFIITFIAQSFVVEGSSMEPNLHNRERLLVNKLVYRFREPQRGDVVVFRYPANPKRKFIKRVIGVAGDIVEVRDGHVILNGEVLEENYTMDLTFGTFGPEVVPAGHYFVLGDNRNNSDDSRFPDVGFVPRRNIVGKAFVAWWPPGEIGLVRTPKLGAGAVLK